MFPHIVLVATSAALPPFAADLVLINGKIWTVDAALPEAQAIAIWRDRIVLVGPDAEAKTLIGSRTRVVDLKQRRAVPGFYDSHTHMLEGGRLLGQVNLKDAKDEAEFGRLLKDFDSKLPRERWILGGNWDHDRTFGGRLPTAAVLDRHVRNRPIFIRRYDGHMGVANSRALDLAGITAASNDPEGGVIERQSDNAPSASSKTTPWPW